MKKIISLTVAILFFVNNISYALSPVQGSLVSKTRNGMYAGAQQLWRAKIGPGGSLLDRILSKWHGHHFIGEKPEIEGTTFNASPKYYPASWIKNPILHKKNLIDALRYFRDNEAQIPAELLEIKEGYYELEKGKEGELPLARIEEYQYGLETRHRLIVHTKLVQMWNHIRKNDVWFDRKFENGETRTSSLAWGIFYRIAQHEMKDLAKKTGKPKGGGHLGWYVEKGKKKIKEERDEDIANQIGGRYNMINSDIWFWFLQAYCFYDSTRYNNRTFRKRMQWVFSRAGSEEGASFLKEFPELSQTWFSSFKENQENLLLTQAINYHFFSRKGVKVPKLKINPKLKKIYKDREYLIVGKPMYAGGKNESNDPINGQKWNYNFKGAALIAAGKISRSIKEKVDTLNQLIGQKAVTELTVDDVTAIKKELDSPWVAFDDFDWMDENAGRKGRSFCKQISIEAKLPFQMIVAIRNAVNDKASDRFYVWIEEIFLKIETGELDLKVVEKTFVEMSTRLSSKKVPTIETINLETALIVALQLKKAELEKDGGVDITELCEKVENKINERDSKEHEKKVDKHKRKIKTDAFTCKLDSLLLYRNGASDENAVIDLLETFAACCDGDVSKEVHKLLSEIHERVYKEKTMRRGATYGIYREITETYIFLAIEKMFTGYSGARAASHAKMRLLIASYVYGGMDNIPEELLNEEISTLEYVKKLRVYIGKSKGLIPQQVLNSTPISGIFESLNFKDKGENKEADIGKFAGKEQAWRKIVELYYCGVVKNIVLVSAEDYKNKSLENQYEFGSNEDICSGSAVSLDHSGWADMPVSIKYLHAVAELGRDNPRKLFVDRVRGQLVAKIVPVEGKEKYWKTVEKDVKDAIKDGQVVKISSDTQKETIDNIIAKLTEKYTVPERTMQLFRKHLKELSLDALQEISSQGGKAFLVSAKKRFSQVVASWDKRNVEDEQVKEAMALVGAIEGLIEMEGMQGTIGLNAEQYYQTAGQDAIPARDDFWQSKIDHATGRLDEKWRPTYDRHEEKRWQTSIKMTETKALVEHIEQVNAKIGSVQSRTGVTIISDYTAPLAKNEGPGAVKPLDEEKRHRVWQGVNASRENNIEIFIPQSVKLTNDMEKKLIEVKQYMKKIGKVLLWERYSAEDESIDKFFKTLKKNKENTKRIVLTDDETVPLLLCQINTRDEIANLFRDIKMINVCLPGSLDEATQTKWQMDLFMTAILARVLEPGDEYFNDIYILLTDMLEGCFSPEIEAKDFVNMLAAKEDEHTSIQTIRKRIKYFLLDTPSVSLIEKLPVEWEAIKEFYHHL